MTEDHMQEQYVIDHVVEDYDLQHYVIKESYKRLS